MRRGRRGSFVHPQDANWPTTNGHGQNPNQNRNNRGRPRSRSPSVNRRQQQYQQPQQQQGQGQLQQQGQGQQQHPHQQSDGGQGGPGGMGGGYNDTPSRFKVETHSEDSPRIGRHRDLDRPEPYSPTNARMGNGNGNGNATGNGLDYTTAGGAAPSGVSGSRRPTSPPLYSPTQSRITGASPSTSDLNKITATASGSGSSSSRFGPSPAASANALPSSTSLSSTLSASSSAPHQHQQAHSVDKRRVDKVIELFRLLSQTTNDTTADLALADAEEKRVQAYTAISTSLTAATAAIDGSGLITKSVGPVLAELLESHTRLKSRVEQGYEKIGYLWQDILGAIVEGLNVEMQSTANGWVDGALGRIKRDSGPLLEEIVREVAREAVKDVAKEVVKEVVKEAVEIAVKDAVGREMREFGEMRERQVRKDLERDREREREREMDRERQAEREREQDLSSRPGLKRKPSLTDLAGAGPGATSSSTSNWDAHMRDYGHGHISGSRIGYDDPRDKRRRLDSPSYGMADEQYRAYSQPKRETFTPHPHPDIGIVSEMQDMIAQLREDNLRLQADTIRIQTQLRATTREASVRAPTPSRSYAMLGMEPSRPPSAFVPSTSMASIPASISYRDREQESMSISARMYTHSNSHSRHPSATGGGGGGGGEDRGSHEYGTMDVEGGSSLRSGAGVGSGSSLPPPSAPPTTMLQHRYQQQQRDREHDHDHKYDHNREREHEHGHERQQDREQMPAPSGSGYGAGAGSGSHSTILRTPIRHYDTLPPRSTSRSSFSAPSPAQPLPRTLAQASPSMGRMDAPPTYSGQDRDQSQNREPARSNDGPGRRDSRDVRDPGESRDIRDRDPGSLAPAPAPDRRPLNQMHAQAQGTSAEPSRGRSMGLRIDAAPGSSMGAERPMPPPSDTMLDYDAAPYETRGGG